MHAVSTVLGGFLFPHLLQCLFDVYGARGGLLVFSAVMLNSTAATFLTRIQKYSAIRILPLISPLPAEVGKELLHDAEGDLGRRGDSAEDSLQTIFPCSVESATNRTMSSGDQRVRNGAYEQTGIKAFHETF